MKELPKPIDNDNNAVNDVTGEVLNTVAKDSVDEQTKTKNVSVSVC